MSGLICPLDVVQVTIHIYSASAGTNLVSRSHRPLDPAPEDTTTTSWR